MALRQWQEEAIMYVQRWLGGLPRGLGGSASADGDLYSDALEVWEYFTEVTGISRETWEAMERDHRAMEALRNSDRRIDIESSCQGANEDGPRFWVVDVLSRGSKVLAKNDDPADAILAALGEGVSDGE